MSESRKLDEVKPTLVSTRCVAAKGFVATSSFTLEIHSFRESKEKSFVSDDVEIPELNAKWYLYIRN